MIPIFAHRQLPDMSNRDYHASAGLSRSDLRRLLDSPRRWLYRQDHPEAPSAAMDFGTAFHCAVLTPGDWDKTVAVVESRRTAAGKVQAADAEAAGLVVLSCDEADRIEGMAATVANSLTATQLLRGKREQSYSWQMTVNVGGGKTFDALCKARPDVVGAGDLWLCDLKSAQTCNQTLWASDAEKYGNDLQVPWYIAGVTGRWPDEASPLPPFVFVVVEKDPPYDLRFFELERTWIHAAADKCLRALRIRYGLHTDAPTVLAEPEIEELSRPRWATFRDEG